jgi:hypothetical protein
VPVRSSSWPQVELVGPLVQRRLLSSTEPLGAGAVRTEVAGELRQEAASSIGTPASPISFSAAATAMSILFRSASSTHCRIEISREGGRSDAA